MMRHRAVLLSLFHCVHLSLGTSLTVIHKIMPPRGGASSVGTAQGVDLPNQRMPSLFVEEESDYDRYAAALAATEALRRIRDKAMSEQRKQKKGVEATEDQKRIRAEYVINSGKVLKAMGMSVSQFNNLSREVNQNEELKEKVMEQAYLYRMASTLHMDRVPLVEDPDAEMLLRSHRKQRIQLFCESMTEIEQVREDQMERLKKSLHVDRLPPGISLSDPAVLPFLSPKVRAVVEAFPLQAEQIVKKHGLQSDEFNRMLDQTRRNPRFRWKVERELKREQQQQAQEQEEALKAEEG